MAHVIQQCIAKDCRADVIFARHAGSDSIAPIDAAPNPDGNVWLFDDGTYLVVSKEQKTYMDLPLFGPGNWHTSHFATCPSAKRFRRERSRKAAAIKRDM